ncbi:MAG: autotransporter-associated beta strand repeat-containing protein [Chthoniobacter sp.]|nr:autotransporter-associated beta strand repeat-containing protein [Chthoniobacter sp.]
MKNARSTTTHYAVRVLAGSILALLAAPAMQADDAVWTGLNSALWSDIGGFGNWDNAPGPVPGTGETATFNAASANTTIDLGAGVTITTVKFDTASADAYTIGSGGQTLTLDPAGAVNMTSSVGADQTVNATIFLGTGNTTDVFTFTNNSLTNSLIFGGDINSGATTGTKTVTLTGAGATVVDGLISDGAGTVAITKTGNGTLTLNAANTYTGQTTITAGSVIVGTTDALGTGAALLVNGGTLAIGGNSNTVGAVTLSSGSITGGATALLTGTSFAVESGTISARLAGGGATLTKTTSGTVTLSAAGTNLRSGLTSINGGTLVMGTAGALGTTGNITFGGGTLKYNSGATTDYSARFKNSTSAIILDANGQTLTFAGTIDSSNTGGLVINGNGTVTISTANTYTGGTTINSGSVNLGNQSGFGAGTVTLTGGVNFATSNFEGNSAGGALPNALVLSGGKVTMNVAFGSAKDIWVNTSVSGAGGFVVTGSGRAQGLTLDGAKTFTGGVTLGTVGSAGDTPNVSINDNASLGTGILRSELLSPNATDGALRINTNLSGVGNNIVIATGARIVIQTLGNNVTLTGVISDEGAGGGLVTAGSGTVTLANTNTFKGSTTIGSGGTIALANVSALQNSTLAYTAGTLTFANSIATAALGGLSGSQGLALTNNVASPVALTVGGNNSTTTYSGTMSGTGGSLTKTGTGTLTLTTAPTYSGDTNINDGTLNMSGTVANSSVVVNSGGALGVTSLVTALNLSQNLTFNGTSAYQIGSGVGGTGSTVVGGNLIVGGTPTLRLTSDNTTPTTGVKDIITYSGSITGSGTAWTVDSSLLNSGGSQVSNWIGGNGTWVTPANWTQQGFGGVVSYDDPNKKVQLTVSGPSNISPIFSTLATIAPGVAAAVTGPVSATTVTSLTIGDAANVNSLTLQSGGPVTATGPVTVNQLGTLTATAASFSAGTLNMNGGTVTLGTSGSAAGVVNLTSGTLVANSGNELAVSNSLVKGNIAITAGTSPFKVGGSNVVSAIGKLMVQGGTTKIVNATYGSVSLADTGSLWSNTSATVSNPFTVTGGNVLVVNVAWRETNGVPNNANAPTISYNGVPLTRASAAYGLVNGYVNSAIYYLFNPTGGSNTLTTNFSQGANTDGAIYAFTLSGVDTTKQPELNTGWTGSTSLEAVVQSVSTTLSNLTPHSWVSAAFAERIPHPPLSYAATGTYASLDTSGVGGGATGKFWYSTASGNINAAGALVTDVTSSTLTVTGSDSTTTNRLSQAAVAFAPTATLFAINQSSTAVDVTGASILDFGAAPTVTLGSLTMQSGGSLTLSNTPAASVSFSNISAPATSGTATIAAGTALTIRNTSSSVDVAGGGRLTVGANIVASGGSGSTTVLQKTGAGVLDITGQLYKPTDPTDALRQVQVRQGVLNLTNMTGYYTLFEMGTASGQNTYVSATNSTIIGDASSDPNGAVYIGNTNALSSYAMHGGTMTLQNTEWLLFGYGGSGNNAILTMDNNAQISLNSGAYMWMGDGGLNNGSATIVMRNGAFNISDPSVEVKVGNQHGPAIINQLGGTFTSQAPIILQYRMNRADCYGIYNLNSGTLAVSSIVSGDNTVNFTQNNTYVNFHGGTLSPTASNPNFIHTTLTGGSASIAAPNLEVFSEGAIIDTVGFNITISDPLRAPTGNGVSGGTINLSSKGSGYRGTPVVYVNSGGGQAATAIANMVDDGTGNGTFMIDSITITNPGVSYTSTPTLSVIGGDPTTAAVLPTLTIAANVSGGLTKNGAGTLTLSAANTFAGDTKVNAGVLALSNNLALQNSALDTSGVGTVTLNVTTPTIGGLKGSTNLTSVITTGYTSMNSLTLNPGTGATDVYSGTVADNGGSSLTVTKTGLGVQNLDGTQSYNTLVVNDGTLNVNGALGTGGATVTVADTAGGVATTLRFGSVSQTLGSLTIGAGATVVFTSGTASGSFGGSGGKGASVGSAAVVPEPGTLGLLLVGALGLLNRRRKQS